MSECGTHAAYVKHMRRGEKACPDCKAAHAAYKSAYRKEHGGDYQRGYAAALRDAVEAVEALERDGEYCKVVHSCEAVDAIEALGGQR